MKSKPLYLLILSISLIACSGKNIKVEKNLPGSDRTAYGCKFSAGYKWCKSINQCVRPWELAIQEGFINSEKPFKEFCTTILDKKPN